MSNPGVKAYDGNTRQLQYIKPELVSYIGSWWAREEDFLLGKVLWTARSCFIIGKE
jgi:hypothetical protein